MMITEPRHSRNAKKELVWREVVMQRPYEMETLHDILTHLASLTSRGVIVWEARCKGGQMRYLIGSQQKSVSRIQEVFKAHADQLKRDSWQWMRGNSKSPDRFSP